ncbi:MAG: DDE-type integrase/transposase/recombinase [Myxococcales bacterium]|nr:DDE-type integrase/transposase/recombinase [Myxococcales bacterium]
MRREDELTPRDHAEAVALFRAQVIGDLAARQLDHGELAAELRERSLQRFRAPGSPVTRTYSVPTLERWLYRLRAGGVKALRPQQRSDAGAARVLDDVTKSLLLDIRREHPSLSAALIMRTLVRKGRIAPGELSVNTLRRLYREHGLERLGKKHQAPGHHRRRWEAAYPSQLWHADVCHGPKVICGERERPLRIHGILDDFSRRVLALVALHQEREVDMLRVFTRAVRQHGKPESMYLDNGSTYRGETLAIACNRMDVRLTHAQPYDPQARGKMERFWRTMRECCLDHTPATATLHDVQIRLLAFLDEYYHSTPHGSLVGDTPEQRWVQRQPREVSEEELQEALTIRTTRRLRGDGTVSVGGIDWEVERGYLAGTKVIVARTLAVNAAPWIEWDDERLPLRPVDPRGNAMRPRKPRPSKGIDAMPFDPMEPLVDAMLGRKKGGV